MTVLSNDATSLIIGGSNTNVYLPQAAPDGREIKISSGGGFTLFGGGYTIDGAASETFAAGLVNVLFSLTQGNWRSDAAASEAQANFPSQARASVPTPASGKSTGFFDQSNFNLLTTKQSDGTYKVYQSQITFNVQDYGALGNGVHDDTTAIQAAITAAFNAQVLTPALGFAAQACIRVWFPVGNYKISDELAVQAWIALIGDRGATLQMTNSAKPCTRIAGYFNDIDSLLFSGGRNAICVYGHSSVLGGNLGSPTNGGYCAFSRVDFRGQFGPSVYFDNTLIANGGSYAPGRIESSQIFSVEDFSFWGQSFWWGTADGVFVSNGSLITDLSNVSPAPPVVLDGDGVPLPVVQSGDNFTMKNVSMAPNSGAFPNQAFCQGSNEFDLQDVRFGGESGMVPFRIKASPTYNGLAFPAITGQTSIVARHCAINCPANLNWLECEGEFPVRIDVRAPQILSAAGGPMNGTLGIWVDSAVNMTTVAARALSGLQLHFELPVNTDYRIRQSADRTTVIGTEWTYALRRFVDGYVCQEIAKEARNNLWLPGDISTATWTNSGTTPAGAANTATGYSLASYTATADGQYIQAQSAAWGAGLAAGEYTFSFYAKVSAPTRLSVLFGTAGDQVTKDIAVTGNFERISYPFYHDGNAKTFLLRAGGGPIFGLPIILDTTNICVGLWQVNASEGASPYAFPVDVATAPTTNLAGTLKRTSVYYGTAIPVAGTYKAGDITINTSAAPGVAQYWVCTTSGTPGTWTSPVNLVSALGAVTLGGTSSGTRTVSEGSGTASNTDSHAEGSSTASGLRAHAEGTTCVASGQASHAEGDTSTASGLNSHAEGASTTASGIHSHASGFGCTASGLVSRAMGNTCISNATGSVADGYECDAIADYSRAVGEFSLANRESESSFASGGFGTQGDAQKAEIVMRGSVPGVAASETTDLKFGIAGTTSLILDAARSYVMEAEIIASAAGGAAVAGFIWSGVIRAATSTAILSAPGATFPIAASPIGATAGEAAGWTVVANNSGTAGELLFTFATNHLVTAGPACKIVAHVWWTEVLEA